MKDQFDKKAHADSAQLACEAAGSIRTIASLTREDDCVAIYSKSLEQPLIQSNKTALWTNFLYAFSQAQVFFIIALVFWYGAVLVSRQEASMFHFFVALMVHGLHSFPVRSLLIFFLEHNLWCSASQQYIHFCSRYFVS